MPSMACFGLELKAKLLDGIGIYIYMGFVGFLV